MISRQVSSTLSTSRFIIRNQFNPQIGTFSLIQQRTSLCQPETIHHASLHTTRANFIKSTQLMKSEASPNTAQTPADEFAGKSRVAGSYHWDFERGLSFLTLPLIGGAAIVGSHPMIDLALGVVIPLHVHLGLDCIVQDYLPHRRVGALNTTAVWILRVSTGLVLYGCYQFNTNDVGITAFTKRIWTGKL